jgi:hypothetical protein
VGRISAGIGTAAANAERLSAIGKVAVGEKSNKRSTGFNELGLGTRELREYDAE